MTLEATRNDRIALGIALIGAALLCTSPAWAISPGSAARSAPPGLAPPEGVEPNDPLYLFLSSHEAPLAEDFDLARRMSTDVQPIHFGFRNRQIKVIHYSTPLRVAQNDMTIKVDAPGAGRAILSVELVFY